MMKRKTNDMLDHIDDTDQKRQIVLWHKLCIEESKSVDVESLAKELGIKNIEFKILEDSDKAGYLEKRGEDFIIGVNPLDSKNRQRFTVAHELAHYLLHRDKFNDANTVLVDNRMYLSGYLATNLEVQANRLAADLLMPINLLAHFIDQNEDITYKELSKKLNVPEQAIKVRLGLPF